MLNDIVPLFRITSVELRSMATDYLERLAKARASVEVSMPKDAASSRARWYAREIARLKELESSTAFMRDHIAEGDFAVTSSQLCDLHQAFAGDVTVGTPPCESVDQYPDSALNLGYTGVGRERRF